MILSIELRSGVVVKELPPQTPPGPLRYRKDKYFKTATRRWKVEDKCLALMDRYVVIL
jgi:hypothetical protein